MTISSPYKVLEIAAAFLFFLVFRPSFTWSMNDFFILIPLAGILLLHLSLKEKIGQFLFLFFFITMAIIPLAHGASVLGFLFYTVFAVIPFLKKDFTLHTFYIFKFILAVITGISLGVWIMVVIMGVDLPHTIIPPLNSLKEYDYLSYPFLVVPMQIGDLFRFSCVFDEPGTVGTYSLLMLYIDDFKLKSWQNVIYLIAGILAFSLFFYVALIFFLLIRVFISPSMKKYRLWAITGIISLLTAILLSPTMNELIGARLEYDEEKGTIAGNNRSGQELDDYIISIRGTSKYFWGDTAEIVEEFSGHASLNNAILRFGFVFLVFFFLFFFLYTVNILKGNLKEQIMTMLLFFLTLYQRPAFVDPAYLFLFTIVILSHKGSINDKLVSRKYIINKSI